LQTIRKQNSALGPRVTLPAVLAQRNVMARLAKSAPAQLRARVVSVHAELSQIVAWQLFNLCDYRSAEHYYHDARTSAHEVEDNELVTHVLCDLSHLATWQGQPRLGIDHAAAASARAQRTSSALSRAYAADIAARAYAADGQADECWAALDAERTAFAAGTENDASARSWWYFYDDSYLLSIRSECALRLGKPEEAWQAAAQSLTLIDPTDVHNYSYTSAGQAEARIQQGNIEEACQLIGNTAKLTATYRSDRMTQRIIGLRQSLAPSWRTKAVCALDDQLAAYGMKGGARAKKA